MTSNERVALGVPRWVRKSFARCSQISNSNRKQTQLALRKQTVNMATVSLQLTSRTQQQTSRTQQPQWQKQQTRTQQPQPGKTQQPRLSQQHSDNSGHEGLSRMQTAETHLATLTGKYNNRLQVPRENAETSNGTQLMNSHYPAEANVWSSIQLVEEKNVNWAGNACTKTKLEARQIVYQIWTTLKDLDLPGCMENHPNHDGNEMKLGMIIDFAIQNMAIFLVFWQVLGPAFPIRKLRPKKKKKKTGILVYGYELPAYSLPGQQAITAITLNPKRE